MKHLMTVLAVAAACLSTSAFAADKAMGTQQTKMASCNADAGDKKGDERKAFMKTCLSAKKEAPAAAAGPMTQQQKMKACNADPKAKATKGDERKAFMKECLSK